MRRIYLALLTLLLTGLLALPRLAQLQQNNRPFLFNPYSGSGKSGLSVGFIWLGIRPLWITWADLQLIGQTPGLHACAQISWNQTNLIDYCPYYR